MSNPKQYRKFHIVDLGTSSNIIKSVNITCPFNVATIKFDFAYVISSSYITNFAVSCDIVNNNEVGILNTYSTTIANNYHFVDGFSVDKTFEFAFVDPKYISGDINFTFRDLNSAFNNINSAQIVIMIECLSL